MMATFLLSKVSHQQVAEGLPSSSKSSEMHTRSSVGQEQSEDAEMERFYDSNEKKASKYTHILHNMEPPQL